MLSKLQITIDFDILKIMIAYHFVVEKNEDIRPYGILLEKYSKIRKE